MLTTPTILIPLRAHCNTTTGGASGSTGAPTSTTTAAAADGEQFWSALLPEAVAAYRAAANAAPEPLGPRRRRAVNYNEKNRGVGAGDAKDDPDFEADDDDNEGGGGSGGGEGGDGAGADGAGDKGQQVKRGRAKAGEVREPKAKRWIRNDLWRLEDALFGYGLCQPQQLLAAATLGPARSDEEVLAVAEALAAMIAKGAELMAALPPAQQGEGGEGGGEDAAMGDAAAERQQGEGGDKARRQRNAGVPDALVAQLQALPAAAALSPAVASAMLATDYLKRLLKNAREWQKQVEEQTALHAYLQTKAEVRRGAAIAHHATLLLLDSFFVACKKSEGAGRGRRREESTGESSRSCASLLHLGACPD